MTQQRSHFFLDVDDDVRLTPDLRSSERFVGRSFWTSSSIGLRLDFGPAFSVGVRASRIPCGPFSPPVGSAETSTDLRGAEKGAKATSRRCSDFGFSVRCVVCTQLV